MGQVVQTIISLKRLMGFGFDKSSENRTQNEGIVEVSATGRSNGGAHNLPQQEYAVGTAQEQYLL